MAGKWSKVTTVTAMLTGILLAKTSSAEAQSLAAVRDSLANMAAINILEHQILIAGELYKVRKFKLPYSNTTNADSLYEYCVAQYRQLYATIAAGKRPFYFSDRFYDATIPVTQYFRNPDIPQLFIIHQQELHPRPVAPDPKHHDAGSHHNHQ